MKYIHYGDTSVMTGDTIAEAVIEYAAVLGANGRTDTIHVPSFDDSGIPVLITLLVGPASEIVLAPAPDDELEPEDPDFVEMLRRGARAAGDAGPVHADGIDVLGGPTAAEPPEEHA